MYFIQSVIIIGVVAHEYSYGWNTSGNRVVPSVIGFVLAYAATWVIFRIRYRARRGARKT
jgi:hypothetical protein